MKTSPEGRALIEAFEGLFLHSYYDSVGVLTIGYGHTNLGNIPPHVVRGDTLTKEEADQALSNDLEKFDAYVDNIASLHRISLNQCQHDALASFDFNTGALARSSIPAKLALGDNSGAMFTLLQYNHAGGKVLPGLTRRRRAERLLFLGHVQDALELAGAHAVIINASGGTPNEQFMAKGAKPA